MTVSEFKTLLREFAASCPRDAPLQRAVNLLERRFSGQEDMALRDFFQKLRAESATPAATSGSDTVETVSSLVATMRSVFGDDREFERVLLTLDAQKSVTKQVLVDVFLKLFERTGGVPKKATRSEILRMILDERNIIIRNEKMGRMLGGRIVPAE